MQLYGTARATAGCSARASELSNLAPRLRPARRTVDSRRVIPGHVCVRRKHSHYETSWDVPCQCKVPSCTRARSSEYTA
eukprot:scaffold16212_cov42-Phaeocystis_antarctica.AAC.2